MSALAGAIICMSARALNSFYELKTARYKLNKVGRCHTLISCCMAWGFQSLASRRYIRHPFLRHPCHKPQSPYLAPQTLVLDATILLSLRGFQLQAFPRRTFVWFFSSIGEPNHLLGSSWLGETFCLVLTLSALTAAHPNSSWRARSCQLETTALVTPFRALGI